MQAPYQKVRLLVKTFSMVPLLMEAVAAAVPSVPVKQCCRSAFLSARVVELTVQQRSSLMCGRIESFPPTLIAPGFFILELLETVVSLGTFSDARNIFCSLFQICDST